MPGEHRHITIIEQTPRGERYYDLFSRLLQDRVIFLRTPIVPVVGNLIVAQFLYLEREGSDPVHLYIHSPGGQISAALAVYDVMQFMRSPVWTYCVGQAASCAAVLLAAGEPGHRYALPSSEVLIHQPSVERVGGDAADLRIRMEHLLGVRHRMNSILAAHTGRPIEDVARDTERDHFLTAEGALEYGLIDHVLTDDVRRALGDREAVKGPA
jgi:ATP-dependent Clp protease protease subunit